MSEKKSFNVRPNSIVIFVNDKKQNANHPDYTGKMYDADGEEYMVSCWAKETKGGKNYLAGQITKTSDFKKNVSRDTMTPKQVLPKTSSAEKAAEEEKLNSDLPF